MSVPLLTKSDAHSKPLLILVDDDEHMLNSLRLALARRYRVHLCNDPLQAVVDIREMLPDLVVLDVKMPEFDGFWVFREIRRFNHETAVVFNSAYQDMVPPDDIRSVAGGVPYLSKNGDWSLFLTTIETALAGQQLPVL